MSVSANLSIESGKSSTFSKFLYKVLTFLICLFFSNEDRMQIDKLPLVLAWYMPSAFLRRKNKSQTTSWKSKHSLKQIHLIHFSSI